MNPVAVKARHATVYALSKTLDLLVLDDGTVWLQRSYREPFVLSRSEAAKLQELCRPQGIVTDGAS